MIKKMVFATKRMTGQQRYNQKKQYGEKATALQSNGIKIIREESKIWSEKKFEKKRRMEKFICCSFAA